MNHDTAYLMSNIIWIYILNDGVGVPYRCLRANIQKVQLEDERIAWSMTSKEYMLDLINHLK